MILLFSLFLCSVGICDINRSLSKDEEAAFKFLKSELNRFLSEIKPMFDEDGLLIYKKKSDFCKMYNTFEKSILDIVGDLSLINLKEIQNKIKPLLNDMLDYCSSPSSYTLKPYIFDELIPVVKNFEFPNEIPKSHDTKGHYEIYKGRIWVY